MALQLLDLNRANDTPVTTLKLSEIVPDNTHVYPAVVPSTSPINVPTVTFAGGAVGDDVAVATANSTTAYTPRTQTEKASLMVPAGSLVVDIGRARGAISPQQPYPVVGDVAPAAPTITTLTPATAVTGAGKPTVAVTITGTGFTSWSTVTSGAFPLPSRYLSPTTLEIIQKPAASVPGTVQVVVTDHGVASNASNFVFT
jgi:hypothetical protein